MEPTSRLMQDLQRDVAEARDEVVWARAMCRMAVLQARQGELDASHATVKRVRAQFGPSLHIEVASWVMMAEGVQHYFHLESRKAHDRLTRAYLLAIALKTESARPACAAWMSLIEFYTSRYEEMAAHIREVLRDAKPDDHHARGRACLVLADAFHVAGSYEKARPWYEKARRHATAEGDQGLLSAMLFNVATCRTSLLRIADTFGDDVAGGELLRASMETSSSHSYDFAVGAKTATHSTPVIKGQLRAIEGKFAEALPLLESADPNGIFKTEAPLLYADRAWVYANLGRMPDARTASDEALHRFGDLVDDDDRAYVRSRISQVERLAGNHEAAEAHAQVARTHLEQHRARQGDLMLKLDELVSLFQETKKPGTGPGSA